MSKGLKLIELRIDSFMRIKSVIIQPKDDVVLISGRNKQGKSSAVNAIWALLGGETAVPDEPIHSGAEKGIIKGVLGRDYLQKGEYIITRIFTKGGTTLTVENADGSKFSAPQSVLDKLLGDLSFDPTGFLRLKPKQQLEAIQNMVKLDVGKMNEKIPEIYGGQIKFNHDDPLVGFAQVRAILESERTDAYREVQRLDKTLQNYKTVAAVEPVSVTELMQEKEKLLDERATRSEKAARKIVTESGMKDAEKRRDKIDEEIKKLEEQLEAKRREHIEMFDRITLANSQIDEYQKFLDENPDPDTTDVDNRIALADETNKAAQRWKDYQQYQKDLAANREGHKQLDAKIKALDQFKRELISSAKFPIPGLAFDETGVIFNDLPLDQASDAEKIKVSAAIEMQKHPQLRIIRIRHGSELDDSTMEEIRQLAKDEDYQFWIEKVDSSGKVGIVIEDGEVQSVNE
jgi:hypothetical protein